MENSDIRNGLLFNFDRIDGIIDHPQFSENDAGFLRELLQKTIEKITEKYEIGIITALPEECAAMQIMLEQKQGIPVPGDPNPYIGGVIRSSNFEKDNFIVVTRIPKNGNNSAASASTDILRSFPNIKDVIFVGIAGGCPNPNNPDKHVRLGDVVVSQRKGIIQYDMLKKYENGKYEIRDTSTPPSAKMTSLVNNLETLRNQHNRPWEKYLLYSHKLVNADRPNERTDILYDSGDCTKIIPHPDDPTRISGLPKIHLGLIGSANILLRDPKERDKLRDELGIIAVEMEGSGLADGTWSHGAQYLIIRGICDYCDSSKNDIWHNYASLAAAAYTRALLERLN